MVAYTFQLSRWTQNIASRLIQANVRVHNIEVIRDNMAIVFAVDRFTRLEALLLPYALRQHLNVDVSALTPGEMFSGRIGAFLRSTGTVAEPISAASTVVNDTLLLGNRHWLAFPSNRAPLSRLVKDNQEQSDKQMHDGLSYVSAAAIALRVERQRQRLLHEYLGYQHNESEASGIAFSDDKLAIIRHKVTVIIPVNVTYYPIRIRDNTLLRLAHDVLRDLKTIASARLSPEGTLFSSDSDIDITLGQPIMVAPLCCEDKATVSNTSIVTNTNYAFWSQREDQLEQGFCQDIQRLVTINLDHILATLIHYQGTREYSELAYRNRLFWCVYQLQECGCHPLHKNLAANYINIIVDDSWIQFQEFINLCVKSGVLQTDGINYRKNSRSNNATSMLALKRGDEFIRIIVNDISGSQEVLAIIKEIAELNDDVLSKNIRKFFIDQDEAIFAADYALHYIQKESQAENVGRPFYLVPETIEGGIVLIHGYLAAPVEVKIMAEYFFACGYAVYCVRLKGHGTAPEDLAKTHWEEWYESVNRGYAVIKTLTNNIIMGGFSTGGVLALLAAARKGAAINAVFAINAPVQFRNYVAHWIPTIVTINTALQKIKRSHEGQWEYIENIPENPDINYVRNPLYGMKQLGQLIAVMQKSLSHICTPALIIQASNDPVVEANSAHLIFNDIEFARKEISVFSFDRHGIVNGSGAEEVFDRIARFLLWSKTWREKHTSKTIIE